MANIHGIDGLGRYDNPPENSVGNQAEGSSPDFLKNIFYNREDRPEPRKETFVQMMRFTFCPGLTRKSFIALVSIF